MTLPRIIHRIWIGSMPTKEQIRVLIEARQFVTGTPELWLWTTSSVASRLQHDNLVTNNIVIRNLNLLWSHPLNTELPVAQLNSVFERESHGVFNNYAAASDIARLMILYCYGGIYLDMDVLFKMPENCLFNDLGNIGGRLGMLQVTRGITSGMGNGVLASKPLTSAVKMCLEKMKELYCSGISGEYSWREKRGYGDMRIYLTMSLSGPRAILEAIQSEQLYPIPDGIYFEPINASGESFSQYPGSTRRDSVPHF